MALTRRSLAKKPFSQDEVGVFDHGIPDNFDVRELTKPNIINLVKDEVIQLRDNYNLAFYGRKLPFKFILDDSIREGRWATGDIGRKSWVIQKLLHNKQEFISSQLVTDVTAEMLEAFLGEMSIKPGTAREEAKRLRSRKTIMNFDLYSQGGKSAVQSHAAVVICTTNTLLGQPTMPLLLLTSATNLEDQYEEEWKRLRGFFNALILVNTDTGEELDVQQQLDHWNFEKNWWIRRAGRADDNNEKIMDFGSRIRNAHENNTHLFVFSDEADVANGPGSILDQMFSQEFAPGRTFYDAMTTHRTKTFTLFHSSATLYPQSTLGENMVYIQPRVEDYYRPWEDIPMTTLYEHGLTYDVPEMGLFSTTASYPYSGVGNVKSFIRLYYKMDGDKLVERTPDEPLHKFTKKQLDKYSEDENVLSTWEWYGDSLLPETLAKLFRNVAATKQKRGLYVRAFLDNWHTSDLIKKIQRIIPDDEMLIIAYTGLPGSDGINYLGKGRPEAALREAFVSRGLKMWEKPIVMFWTSQGRRGNQCPDGFYQVEMTKKPSFHNSALQKWARGAGNFKDNTALVVTETEKNIADQIKRGGKPLPMSMYTHQHQLGDDAITLELTREHAANHPELKERFEAIQKDFLGHWWMYNRVLEAEEKRDGKSTGALKGGWKWVRKMAISGPGGCPNIYDYWTDDIMSIIEADHKTIFVNDQGQPLYESILFQRPGEENENGDIYDFGFEHREADVEEYARTGKRWHEILGPVEDRPDVLPDNFGPVGLRHRDSNTNVYGAKASRMQIQLHYELNKRLRRLDLVKMAVRLFRQSVGATVMIPGYNTVSWKLHMPERQAQYIAEYPHLFEDVLEGETNVVAKRA